MNIEMLAALEPENCFKRLFCSAATGQLGNKVSDFLWQSVLYLIKARYSSLKPTRDGSPGAVENCFKRFFFRQSTTKYELVGFYNV